MSRWLKLRDHPWNWFLRLAVGAPFVFAGIMKIADPSQFTVAVSNYRLAPQELVNLIAIVLPWIEVVAGLLVLAGVWMRAATLVITSLTAVFLIVITSALARGLNIECGCFGTAKGTNIGLQNLLIDLTLFCLAAALLWRTRENAAPSPH